MDQDGVKVHKSYAKKVQGQYPAILTEQAWAIMHLLVVRTPDDNDRAKEILIIALFEAILKFKVQTNDL